MSTETESADKDFTLEETARKIRMSSRWIRDQIKAGQSGDGPFIEHTRRGHKIVFTADQLEALRRLHAQKPPVVESITTGKKKRSA